MQFGFVFKDRIKEIILNMNAYGYAVLTDVFSTKEIACARSFVEVELARRQGQYFSFAGREAGGWNTF